MKANELMIGDFVTFAVCQTDDDPVIIRVVSLGFPYGETNEGYHYTHNENCALVSIDGDGTLDIIEIDDDIAGIPLTGAILGSSGFGYKENDAYGGLTHYYPGEAHYCADMDLHIGTDNKGVFWLNSRGGEARALHYVHELQHAFRIFGIDREVKL